MRSAIQHDDDQPEPAAAFAARVHRVPTAGGEKPEPMRSSEPLHIDYTTTQVMPDLMPRLRRLPGILATARSPLGEAFKMLRHQVLQRMRAEGHKLLAVTSARAAPGKSLAALNLAMSIAADHNASALLVDGDLSGLGLQELAGLLGARGLSDHLGAGVPIPELLLNPGLPRLVLLPAGQQPVSDSAELLGARAAAQLMQELKSRYPDRYVIVDLPPLLDTADALSFLPLADTTLVVLEEHRTSLQDMEAMRKLLAPFNLVGTVLCPAGEQRKSAAPPRRPWYRR